MSWATNDYQLGPHALEKLRRSSPAVPEPRRSKGKRIRTVIVPTDLALVYDGTGWHFAEPGQVPPQWWLEMTEPEIADASEMAASPGPVMVARRTNCRRGNGPCRRRHEHASSRRAAA
jgi:hypothetical protein